MNAEPFSEPDSIGFRLTTTKTPRPDAPTYTFRTVKEMFDAINPENVDRFLTDFDAGFRAAVLFRETLRPIIEAMGEEAVDDIMNLDSFTWIDDNPIH